VQQFSGKGRFGRVLVDRVKAGGGSGTANKILYLCSTAPHRNWRIKSKSKAKSKETETSHSRLESGHSLAATRAIRGQVVATAPAALKRTFTLRELAALLEAHPWGDAEGDPSEVLARAADWRASVSGLGSDLDVPDPIGRSPQVHRAAADLADRATRVIAAWLG